MALELVKQLFMTPMEAQELLEILQEKVVQLFMSLQLMNIVSHCQKTMQGLPQILRCLLTFQQPLFMVLKDL